MKEQRGSITLFILFVCLAVAVLVQTVSAVVLCATHTLVAEEAGRATMAQKDEALAALRQGALSAWGPLPWGALPEVPGGVEGCLVPITGSEDRALAASARSAPAVSPVIVSARVERGRDGLDLPLSGLVARALTWPAGRTAPWFEMEDPTMEADGGADTAAGAAVRLVTVPAAPLLGPGATIAGMSMEWRLDDGWRKFFEALAAEQPGGSTDGLGGAAAGMAAAAGVAVVSARPGTTVTLPADWGVAADQPGLLVITGGADLDAQGRGGVYGVIVVDGGGVTLDGTRLHGALFVTRSADVGETGVVLFSRATLRWATDRALVRTRLVPGSRTETTAAAG
jgi:hypothetical protein